MYLPVLAAVAAPFFVMIQEGFWGFGFALKHLLRSRSFFFFDIEGPVLVLIGVGVLGVAVYLLHWVFDYEWPQAIVIVILEPLLWIFLFTFVMALSEAPRPAADPRDQLIADLSAFLAILAVPLQEEYFDQEMARTGQGVSSVALVEHDIFRG